MTKRDEDDLVGSKKMVKCLKVVCGLEICVCVHLCGVFPGSCVLCNEVNADTSPMHRHRTPTGKKD